MRSRVARVLVRDLPERLALLAQLESDITASCQIERLEMEEGNELAIELEFEDVPGEPMP
jgi:hypothetical protein